MCLMETNETASNCVDKSKRMIHGPVSIHIYIYVPSLWCDCLIILAPPQTLDQTCKQSHRQPLAKNAPYTKSELQGQSHGIEVSPISQVFVTSPHPKTWNPKTRILEVWKFWKSGKSAHITSQVWSFQLQLPWPSGMMALICWPLASKNSSSPERRRIVSKTRNPRWWTNRLNRRT